MLTPNQVEACLRANPHQCLEKIINEGTRSVIENCPEIGARTLNYRALDTGSQL